MQLFIMRLSSSGRGFAMAFVHQAQEAFLEGHALAFAHFGGVPSGLIRYDNLKAAVLRVVMGRERVINERFIALRSHYLFDSFFCCQGSTAPMRRVGWRVRSAGSPPPPRPDPRLGHPR